MTRAEALDAALLAACKALLVVYLVHAGFTHVSDDDYARTVIAEQLVNAPKLDPSGTSWLPFPFWWTGAAMAVLGRSIGVARAAAATLGAASVAAPYLVLRRIGVARWATVAACLLAIGAPWNAWLGAAPVPEAFVGALVAAGAFACARSAPSSVRTVGALALLVASLSRYEAWPVCAVLAAVAAWNARPSCGAPRARTLALVAAAVAIAGPALWMAWNAHAHGSATHFLARVSAYRRAIGAAQIPLEDKLLGYPRALAASAPHLLLLAAVGAAGLGDAALRARWRGPLLASAALLAFLVVGDVRDGAPTHHPERALAALYWVLAAFGVDGSTAAARRFAWARPRREIWVAGLAAAFGVTWASTVPPEWRSFPGASDDESRAAQVARGLALRAADARSIEVTPCAYEHFALLAAFGAPERATIDAATHAPVTADCPAVVVR